MSAIFSKAFWLDAGERAVKTFGQVAVLTIGTDKVDLTHLDYKGIAAVAGGGALLSVLTSLASARVGSADSASLLPAKVTPQHAAP